MNVPGGSVIEGYTAVQSAQVVHALSWASNRLFDIFGHWASVADRSDVAVSLATASRHMGWHAKDLSELAPDSVLLEGHTDNERFEKSDAVLDDLRAGTDSIVNLAISHRVLLARLGARCAAVEKTASAHGDAALARTVGFMLTDLRRDCVDGEILLELLMSDCDTVKTIGLRVVEAECLVVEAGGLPPM